MVHEDLDTAKKAYLRLIKECGADSRRMEDRICIKVYQEKATHGEKRISSVYPRDN
jgi:hypothetical protein